MTHCVEVKVCLSVWSEIKHCGMFCHFSPFTVCPSFYSVTPQIQRFTCKHNHVHTGNCYSYRRLCICCTEHLTHLQDRFTYTPRLSWSKQKTTVLPHTQSQPTQPANQSLVSGKQNIWSRNKPEAEKLGCHKNRFGTKSMPKFLNHVGSRFSRYQCRANCVRTKRDFGGTPSVDLPYFFPQ